VNLNVAIELAQLVGLAAGKAGADHRHLHRALLKQRHAQRLAEDGLQFGRRILDLLLALAAPQIGMHHVALDRSRPNNRHLDDEIIKGLGLQPRQHRHLGADSIWNVPSVSALRIIA
jgi:methylphosphotriester-DNA--protein-cysteine methyltransferase